MGGGVDIEVMTELIVRILEEPAGRIGLMMMFALGLYCAIMANTQPPGDDRDALS